jgi:molybdopterin converting factor small subunit
VVTIQLPRVLAQVTGGTRSYEVSGQTLQKALEDLVEREPRLGVHLFDEAGRMRRHILCFCNGEHHRGRDGLDVSVSAGDTITILNSVSGG